MRTLLTALVAVAILLPAGMCRCEVLAPFAAQHDSHDQSVSCCPCHHQEADDAQLADHPARDHHEPACPEETGAMQWKTTFVSAPLLDLAAVEQHELLPDLAAGVSMLMLDSTSNSSRPIYLLHLNLLI